MCTRCNGRQMAVRIVYDVIVVTHEVTMRIKAGGGTAQLSPAVVNERSNQGHVSVRCFMAGRFQLGFALDLTQCNQFFVFHSRENSRLMYHD